MTEKKMTMASAVAAAAFASTSAALASEAITITHARSQPGVVGAPDRFTGSVRVEDNFKAKAPATVGGATVTFEPGARTAWHSHPLGQTLIVTSGVGVVQMWEGPHQEMRSGDTVWIPPGVNHWHGASPRNGMTHIAFSESLDGKSVDWLELVTDAQYSSSPTTVNARRSSSLHASSIWVVTLRGGSSAQFSRSHGWVTAVAATLNLPVTPPAVD